jgi:hypothetical protein
MNLKIINQAIFDTMQQVAPDHHFILVTWRGTQTSISSNELDTDVVATMLTSAARVVLQNTPQDIELDDEFAGTA